MPPKSMRALEGCPPVYIFPAFVVVIQLELGFEQRLLYILHVPLMAQNQVPAHLHLLADQLRPNSYVPHPYVDPDAAPVRPCKRSVTCPTSRTGVTSRNIRLP